MNTLEFQREVARRQARKRFQGVFAYRCRKSFWLFLNYGFGARQYCKAHPDEAWLVRRVHKPMCDWFQSQAEEWFRTRSTRREPTFLLFLVPRGFGKTTSLTIAGSIWLQLQDPDISEFISSFSKEMSMDFLSVIQNVMGGNAGQALWRSFYGSWEPGTDSSREWSKSAAVHSHRRDSERKDPSFEAVSVSTGTTGSHPDVVFIDDPVVEEKLTQESNWMEKCEKHMAAILPAMKTNGLLVLVMTRYRDNDPARSGMVDQGVKEFAETGMLPREQDMTYRPDGKWRVFFMRARHPDGTPTLPEIWPDERLSAYQKDHPLEYASQMMNDPGEGGHQPLTREIIDSCKVAAKDVPRNLRISIHIDRAFKDLKTRGRGDYNAIQVWGHARDGSGEIYYLRGYRNNEWTDEEFYKALMIELQTLEKARMWPFYMTDEHETGGAKGSVESAIKAWCRRYGLPTPRFKYVSRGGKSKGSRHRAAATFWRMGKVRLVDDAPELEHLIYEMLNIESSRHDDMADCAADVFDDEVYVHEARRAGGTPGASKSVRPLDDILQGRISSISVDEARAIQDDFNTFAGLGEDSDGGAWWRN